MIADNRTLHARRITTRVLRSAAILSALFMLIVSAEAASTVIATGGEQGNYFRLGDLLKTHLQSEEGNGLQVRATDGSLENIKLLQAGKADFAFIQGGLQCDMEGLRAIASLDREYVHMIVRADSGIARFEDIAGRRVTFGPAGSGSSALGSQVAEFYRLSPPPIVVQIAPADIAQALDTGKLDAAFTVYGLFAPVVEQILSQEAHRLMPFPEASAVARYIPGVSADTIPAGAYGPTRNQPSPSSTPFMTLGVNTLLVARNDASPSAVKDLLHTIYSVDFRKAARLGGLTEERGSDVVDLPLHDAAYAYYHRNDPLTSDRFEIASFFLAGIVVIGSTLHFVVRAYTSRKLKSRRQHIIPYFEELLALAREVENTNDIDRLTALIRKMMETQHRAEEEWLKGRLDTEHVENFFAIYSIRSRNAFSKILEQRLACLTASGEETGRRK